MLTVPVTKGPECEHPPGGGRPAVESRHGDNRQPGGLTGEQSPQQAQWSLASLVKARELSRFACRRLPGAAVGASRWAHCQVSAWQNSVNSYTALGCVLDTFQ